jgi:hypothetical protein
MTKVKLSLRAQRGNPPNAVIASAARQSSFFVRGWIAASPKLPAMTTYAPSR